MKLLDINIINREFPLYNIEESNFFDILNPSIIERNRISNSVSLSKFQTRNINTKDLVEEDKNFISDIDIPLKLVNYKEVGIQKTKFHQINLNDTFFQSLKEDYQDFEKWFFKKSNNEAYITSRDKTLLSFLYLKIEEKEENYKDIFPLFSPKKRLKVGTLKVNNNGFKLGEYFMNIAFETALTHKAEQIYVTLFDKREEQHYLIKLLEQRGFSFWGKKKDELVYIRDL
jgi:hypothetical protein